MNFGKTLLAVILGIFLSFGIFFMMLSFLFTTLALAFSQDDDIVDVKDNSVLVVDFSQVVTDYGNKDFFDGFDLSGENYNNLYYIIQAIKNAKEDKHIKGISIKSTPYLSGIPQIKEVRDAIKAFKSSGKFVYAYNDAVSQSQYYLQSVADSIFLNPAGGFEFHGLSAELLYFKDFEDKYGVKFEVVRHGKYKSAVEPFLQNKISDENREQITSFLSSIWDSMIEEIAESRGIPNEQLNNIATNVSAETPQTALQHKLIDKLSYQDEFNASLVRAVQVENIDEVNFVNVVDYAKSTFNHPLDDLKEIENKKDKIAILYAEGDIVYQSNDKPSPYRNGVITHHTINKALKKIREDENVKAVILRVNSPGGSALASELIHREIEITKKHIPVYVSMGNYAASGGYYISCGANKIFADKATITGSIGIFAMLPNAEGLASSIGINAERVSTHNNDFYYSPLKKPTSQFISQMKNDIETGYKLFTQRVADGRSMTPEQVDEIAQGRVWTGQQALDVGLVDKIASLDETIQFVAQELDLKDYDTAQYPSKKIDIKYLLSDFGFSVQEKISQNLLGEQNYNLAKKLSKASQLQGIQAHIPYIINIQ